eukprot:426364_1
MPFSKNTEGKQARVVMSNIKSNLIDIFVKTLNGKTITIETESHASVHDIKEIILQKQGLPILEQILTFGRGPLMNDSSTIDSYGITADCTLHLSLRLLSKASTVTIKLRDGNEQCIQFTPDTTVRDIKQTCALLDSSISYLNMADINFIHLNRSLSDNNMKVANIPGIWDDSVFHIAIASDTYHRSTSIQWTRSQTQYVQNITNIDFTKSLDELVRTYFQKCTDLDSLFTSTQCMLKSVQIRFRNTTINVKLNRIGDLVRTFGDNAVSSTELGTIPLHLSLSTFTQHFTECSCCFMKDTPTEREVHHGYNVSRNQNKSKPGMIGIIVQLPDIGFIYNNHFFYLGNTVYKRYDEEEHKRRLNFQFHPIVIREELLIAGYIRCIGQHVPMEIMQLIGLLMPQYYGGQYEVCKHNDGFSSTCKQTNVFMINGIKCYLKREGRKTCQLSLNKADDIVCGVWMLCQIQCKATKQSYTMHLYMHQLERTSEHYLKDFGFASSLEELICNIQILKITNFNEDTPDTVYRYPFTVNQNAYLLEWSVNETIQQYMFHPIHHNVRYFRSFESPIYSDLFLLRLQIVQYQEISLVVQLLTISRFKVKCQAFVNSTRLRIGTPPRTRTFESGKLPRDILFKIENNNRQNYTKSSETKQLTFRVSIQLIQ